MLAACNVCLVATHGQTQTSLTTPLQFFSRRRLDRSPLPLVSVTPFSLWMDLPWVALDYSWIFIMASHPPSTSTPTSTSPSSPAVYVSAHRSCHRRARRMNCINYDKHTICNLCRDICCFVDVRCSECSSWPADVMQDYLNHRNT